MEKLRINQKSKKKTRNAASKKKQTNTKRKEIFLSSRCHMVGPFMYRTLCQKLARVTKGFFLNCFKPEMPFINHRNNDAPLPLLRAVKMYMYWPLLEVGRVVENQFKLAIVLLKAKTETFGLYFKYKTVSF